MISKEFDYPNKLEKIFEKLDKLGLQPIIVGGYIRDFYLHKSSKDIDIEIYGLDSIEELSPILEEFGIVYEVGKSFGVCKLSFQGLDLDFSMPRIDNKTSSGHKGFEVITKKELDFKTAASRRDFTINTMGYDTKNKIFLDPFNGLVDLKANLLKMVDKNSFIEDPLRVFRAMGFVARFDLKVEQDTLDICRKMINKKMLNELSKERIYEELKKLFLKSKKPSLGFDFFKQIDGLNFFRQLKMTDALWEKSMDSLDNFSSNTNLSKLTDGKTNIKLLLVLLCYHLEQSNTISFIEQITNEKKVYIEVLELIKNVKILINKHDTYTLRKIATNVVFSDVFQITDALGIDTLEIKNKVHELKIMTNSMPKLLQGRDLISLGLKPSPEFSKILELAYENQLDSKFDNKADAMVWLKQYLKT